MLNAKRNVVPLPGALSTVISASCSCKICLTTTNPKPVPRPRSLVVKRFGRQAVVGRGLFDKIAVFQFPDARRDQIRRRAADEIHQLLQIFFAGLVWKKR